jgi:hypothetical protein
MRMNRILSGVLGLALAGAAPVITANAAVAATGATSHSAVRAGAPSSTNREALPKRKISEKIVEGSNKLIFKGKVKGDPTYKKKIVKIQIKKGSGGSWHFLKKVKTGRLARFQSQVPAGGRNCNSTTGKGAGCWYFRALTPKTGKYRQSHSAGHYFTFRY